MLLMNSVLPFTSNSHMRRCFSAPSLFKVPNTTLLRLTLANILFTAAASKGPREKEGEAARCNTKPWSVLGLPTVTIRHQGGAETPLDTTPALLPRDAYGQPCCWDLPVPSHPAR